MNAALQLVIVGLLVAWSVGVLFGRFCPQTAAVLRQRLAGLAARHGENGVSRWLGRAPASSGGCGDGCGGCKTGCASAPPPTEQAVTWRSPPSSGACH